MTLLRPIGVSYGDPNRHQVFASVPLYYLVARSTVLRKSLRDRFSVSMAVSLFLLGNKQHEALSSAYNSICYMPSNHKFQEVSQ